MAPVPGTNCTLLIAAIWMEDVTVPDALYDEERSLSEVDSAYHLANLNILAYLIDLRDSRTENVLVSRNDKHRRVLAIDNGVSFGTIWYNWITPSTYAWREIRISAHRPDRGTQFDGTMLQFGLTDDEVDDVWERIESLIMDVDEGEIGLF
jgi:hypothetical protein